MDNWDSEAGQTHFWGDGHPEHTKDMEPKNPDLCPIIETGASIGVSGLDGRTTEVATTNGNTEQSTFAQMVRLELSDSMGTVEHGIVDLSDFEIDRLTEIIYHLHEAAVQRAEAEAIKRALMYVRDHSSGGGSWRRTIELEIAKIDAELD